MIRRWLVLVGALVVAFGLSVSPAQAIHLFPTAPNGYDPIGHTCGTTLSPAPAYGSLVHVAGF
ncbi:MAG: hypothetical protein ACYDAD_14090, partial [Acidimicrobiales bacterium]